MNNRLKSESVYNRILNYRGQPLPHPSQPADELRQFPLIPPALMTELERRWPHLSPQPGETLDSLHWRGGCREVVDFLRAAYDAQQGDPLSRPVIAEALAEPPK